MTLLNVRNLILSMGAVPLVGQSKSTRLTRGFGLPLLTVMFAWIAQIIFWRLLGGLVPFRMSLLWLALPIGCYFLAALAAASLGMMDMVLRPAWIFKVAWVLLTCLCTAFSTLSHNILLFGVSAALFGAGLPFLLHKATLKLGGKPRVFLFGATLCGIVIGLIATGGTIFVNLHLPQLAFAFACCLVIVLLSSHLQSNITPTSSVRTPSKLEAANQAGCGVLMAAPIALAPVLQAMCGVGVAGFGLAFMAHYGAMLLPGFFVGKLKHTFSSYAVSAAYVASMVFGHALPLLGQGIASGIQEWINYG